MREGDQDIEKTERVIGDSYPVLLTLPCGCPAAHPTFEKTWLPALLSVVNITKCKHSPEMPFVVPRETATGSEFISIFVCPKHTVPNRKIAEIETVNIKLVVYGVQFGRLDEILEETRRFKVRVVEKFSCRRKYVKP